VARVDVALEEYKALRAEILAIIQAQTAIVTVALTATAAIAGIAFGTKPTEGRLEILLALPLVLSGLGLAYLTHSYGSALLGRYIEDHLWEQLRKATPDQQQGVVNGRLSSWEEHIRHYRGLGRALTSVRGWLSFLPGLFIFGVPSAAALIINWKDYAWTPFGGGGSGLEWAWFIGAVVTTGSLTLLLLAGRRPRLGPATTGRSSSTSP
jgi:hypothetical protein